MTNQQPTARTAADLPKGTRVTSPEGRTGTVNGYDIGRVTNTEHVNYGREYIGVTWDPTESIPWGQRNRPFVDELTIVAPAEKAEGEEAREASADEVTETTPRFVVNQLGNGYFAVRDTATDLDVATAGSRYAAQDKAERLEKEAATTSEVCSCPRGESNVYRAHHRTACAPDKEQADVTTERPKCGHGFALMPGVTSTVKCEFGHEYGVFGDEGPIDRSFCAVQAANDAAFYTAEDDGDTQYVVKVICPDHDQQAKDTCEECAAEGCGAVDAEDLDACGECSDCTG